MVYIVGLGPGHRDYLTGKAMEVLEKSTVIIGFSRAVDSIDFIACKKVKVDSLKDTIDYINHEKEAGHISIIASGDPLFYGITDYIKNNYNGEIKVVPGITSFQYLMSKVNMSWSKSYTGSLHGREDDFLNKVKENEMTIWLCDKKNTPKSLCEKLIADNIKCQVIIGENLSYEDERIDIGDPKKFIYSEYSNLSVFVVRKV